jgi:hypothetical protein
MKASQTFMNLGVWPKNSLGNVIIVEEQVRGRDVFSRNIVTLICEWKRLENGTKSRIPEDGMRGMP